VLTGAAHLVLVAAALVGCGVWWKRASRDRVVLLILAVGLLARAVPGLILFEISEARLPLGRSWQLEPGFWFFAPDAIVYYHVAAGAAAKGLAAMATLGPLTPSRFYVETLAASLYVFGASPATSLLLNLLAYAALAAVVLRWHRRTSLGRGPLLVALAAVSLAPSWMLWSYQPLKDTYLLLLIGLFFLTMDAWYTQLSADRWRWWSAIGFLSAQAVIIYGLAGVRWYYAAVVALTPVGLIAALARQETRSFWRACLALGGALLIVEVIVPGAGRDMPPWVRLALQPTSVQSIRQLWEAPTLAAGSLTQTLDGNVRAKGTTLIRTAGDPGAGATQELSATPFARRLRGSLAVLTLPKALALRAGDVSIAGGRWLWAFADLDTLLFEATIIGCAWVLVFEIRRGASLRPAFWHVLAATVAITGLLAAEATNFGTLLRMRSMIAMGIALLPLTIERGGTRPALSHP
jgi:hypothetical protein